MKPFEQLLLIAQTHEIMEKKIFPVLKGLPPEFISTIALTLLSISLLNIPEEMHEECLDKIKKIVLKHVKRMQEDGLKENFWNDISDN